MKSVEQGLRRSSVYARFLTRPGTVVACGSVRQSGRSVEPRFFSGKSRPRAPRTTLVPRVQRQNSVRTLFIQTENTPNVDALKFVPNTRVLPENFQKTFLEYNTPRSTLLPPYPSPLAANILGVDGVTSVFYGSDYITVTKDSSTQWGHVKPEVFSLITEAVTSGEPMVKQVEAKAGEETQEGIDTDTLSIEDSDSEVVQMVKELLDTRIRPAIQEDGGDIEYRGMREGWVLLKLRGACRTCDSSTVTLRNGIENMLMHYISEVKGVEQVLDQEEEIAMAEFAKFEERLRQQKGHHATAPTDGKGTLDATQA